MGKEKLNWRLIDEGEPHLKLFHIDGFDIIFTLKGGEGIARRLNPVSMKQVHGSQVHIVDRKVDGLIGDAVITGKPGLYISIRVADCYPVYLIDPGSPAVGLAHSGWRGTLKRIAVKTLYKMIEKFGTDPQRVIVALGPGISPKHYEVGPEVAKLFKRGINMKGNRFYLNLPHVIKADLVEAGVKEENIVEPPMYTDREPEFLYSLRRDGKINGEMWALAAISKSFPGHFNS